MEEFFNNNFENSELIIEKYSDYFNNTYNENEYIQGVIIYFGIFGQTKNIEKAKELFENVTQSDLSDLTKSYAYCALAMIYFRNFYTNTSNDNIQAIQFLETSIKLNPKNYIALCDLGYIYYMGFYNGIESDYTKATEYFEACLKINPNDENSSFYLNKIYNKEDEYYILKEFLKNREEILKIKEENKKLKEEIDEFTLEYAYQPNGYIAETLEKHYDEISKNYYTENNESDDKFVKIINEYYDEINKYYNKKK